VLDRALEFVRKVKERKPEGVLSLILFGSVARGEGTRESDIDIAVIYSEKDPGIVKMVDSLAEERIQLTHLSLEELKEEPTLSGALSGEGILLYGHPISIKAEEIELKPMMLIAYDTTELGKNDRSRLQRALYGGVSTYMKRGERKVKEYTGAVQEVGAERIGKGVLLVERRRYPRIIGILKAYRAKYKEIPVWTY
jgi:predicted nucleotidyltransferase